MEEKILIDKVRDFVKKTGYPFELEVADLLEKKGWITFSSVEYFMPNTNTQRELDIVAYKIIRDRRIELRIACKRTEKPWIIFTRNHRYIKSGYELIFTPAEINFDKYSNIPNILKELNFFKYNRYAINYTAMSEKNTKEARNAITDALYSTITSCYDRIYPFLLKDNRGTIYFFTVVVDTNLFEAYYDKKDEVKEIEYSQYHLKYLFENTLSKEEVARLGLSLNELKEITYCIFERMKIEIVKMSYLEKYLENIEEVFLNLTDEQINNFGEGWSEFFRYNNIKN